VLWMLAGVPPARNFLTGGFESGENARLMGGADIELVVKTPRSSASSGCERRIRRHGRDQAVGVCRRPDRSEHMRRTPDLLETSKAEFQRGGRRESP
jgi:hypothetical protein